MKNKTTQIERIAAILSDGQWHSTKELIDRTGITYPPRRIFDLKKQGVPIEARRTEIDGYHWEEYRIRPEGIRSDAFNDLKKLKEEGQPKGTKHHEQDRLPLSLRALKVEELPILHQYEQ